MQNVQFAVLNVQICRVQNVQICRVQNVQFAEREMYKFADCRMYNLQSVECTVRAVRNVKMCIVQNVQFVESEIGMSHVLQSLCVSLLVCRATDCSILAMVFLIKLFFLPV